MGEGWYPANHWRVFMRVPVCCCTHGVSGFLERVTEGADRGDSSVCVCVCVCVCARVGVGNAEPLAEQWLAMCS